MEGAGGSDQTLDKKQLQVLEIWSNAIHTARVALYFSVGLIELAFLYNPSHLLTFQATLEPPVPSRCFFSSSLRMAWREKQQILNGWKCRISERLCGSCRDIQLSHSYAPSAKRLPFHCKHSKNGKKQRGKFLLVGEMCDFITAKCGFLGVCRRIHNYLERQSGGAGASGSLACFPPVLHQVLTLSWAPPATAAPLLTEEEMLFRNSSDTCISPI